MSFVFDAKTFVRPCYETEQGDWASESMRKFAEFYPELSHWGALALAMAWQGYSQDVWLVSWEDINIKERDESFLDYCCWVQTRGRWGWERDFDRLAKANYWKS